MPISVSNSSHLYYVQAAEVDSYTQRTELLSIDPHITIEKINQHTNLLFEEAVKSANNSGPACNEMNLYSAVYDKVGGFLFGKVEDYILNSKDIFKIYLPKEKSIYQDYDFWDAFPYYITKDTLGAAININGYVVGADKFGHFFGQGYTYFKRTYLDLNASLEKAIANGHESESLYFGLQTTGVYSYGDLSANYEGMRFWKKLIGKRTNLEDTKIDSNPYVKCINNKWVINNPIDWNEYVSPAWDEGINCSLFLNASAEQKVNNRIKEQEKIQGIPLTCPIVPEMCQQVVDRYKHDPRVAKHLISPKCAKKVNFKLKGEPDFFEKRDQYDTNTRTAYSICTSLCCVGELALGNILSRIGIYRSYEMPYFHQLYTSQCTCPNSSSTKSASLPSTSAPVSSSNAQITASSASSTPAQVDTDTAAGSTKDENWWNSFRYTLASFMWGSHQS